MTATKTQLNRLETLPKEILTPFILNSPDMPLRKMAELACQSKNNYGYFKPALNEAKEALPLLLNVVQGNLEALINQVVENPQLYFKKGQVTDPSGTTFYNVSAYQLVKFLCDADMDERIRSLIPNTIRVQRGIRLVDLDTQAIREQQYAQIGCGGADLVKMDRDPTTLDFEEIMRFKTTYTINGVPTAVVLPLLENPDGIIYYQNPVTEQPQLYYANQNTKTVEPLELKISSPGEQKALDELYASFNEVENNSARRSNDEEHALIARLSKHELSRKGIQYVHQGKRYCDNRIEFKLINAYRKCIRLYGKQCRDGDDYWCTGVGGAQRQVLWVLQRLCEPDRPSFPLPDFNASPFQRSFKIYNYVSDEKSVCLAGRLVNALGRAFAVFKGGCLQPRGVSVAPCRSRVGLGLVDLVAVNWLIEDAKTRVREFKPDMELTVHDSHQGLGC